MGESSIICMSQSTTYIIYVYWRLGMSTSLKITFFWTRWVCILCTASLLILMWKPQCYEYCV